jgi:hypothetical protein
MRLLGGLKSVRKTEGSRAHGPDSNLESTEKVAGLTNTKLQCILLKPENYYCRVFQICRQ